MIKHIKDKDWLKIEILAVKFTKKEQKPIKANDIMHLVIKLGLEELEKQDNASTKKTP